MSRGYSWEDDAACKDHDDRLFFPSPADREVNIRIAKFICKRCPVQDECLNFALTHKVGDTPMPGIWAGTTEKERQEMRKYMQIAPRVLTIVIEISDPTPASSQESLPSDDSEDYRIPILF